LVKLELYDESVKKEGFIDVFLLKIYALLLCRGDLKTKIEVLMDLITLYQKSDKIMWSNKRLELAMKSIVYFSEILPKKYFQMYENEVT
jgi:hypothetical protein